MRVLAPGTHRPLTQGQLRTESNRRLTAGTGLVLAVLLVAESATVLLFRLHLVAPHILLGLLVVPPLGLKLGTTGYRFARYYLRDADYRAAGPPGPMLRWTAPVLVVSTVALFATGVEVWLFGDRFGPLWLQLHKLSFLIWGLFIALHTLGHLEGALSGALRDLRRRTRLRGARRRWSYLLVSLAFGVLLAVLVLLRQGPNEGFGLGAIALGR